MPKYVERDGLRFYSEPYKITLGEYMSSHWGCCAIVDMNLHTSPYLNILIDSVSPEYNEKVRSYKGKEPNYGLLSIPTLKEAMSIDEI